MSGSPSQTQSPTTQFQNPNLPQNPGIDGIQRQNPPILPATLAEYPNDYLVEVYPDLPSFESLLKIQTSNPFIRGRPGGTFLEQPVILMDMATQKSYGSINPFPVTSPPGSALISALVQNATLDVSATVQAPRTPTWVYQAQCTTVAATQVVPAVAGKRHRILGGVIIWSAGMLAAGVETLEIQDAAGHFGTGGLIFSNYLPIAASLTGLGVNQTQLNNLANGFASAAVNTAINVVLGTGITAGSISVTLWGDDE